jgi:endonuclease/exonuclease/phosphatase family metal-dependent hydrolase
MRITLQILGAFLFLLLWKTGFSQQADRIAFYNVENFFDTEYDSTKRFNGFTPEGDHHWTKSRYYQKKRNIYKILAALGRWQGITLIGLAEIENRKVLEDLVNTTPLKKFDYGIIHYESPDKRGIDLGVLYLKNRFIPLESKPFHLKDPQNRNFTTRDILYVKGIVQGDTVHVFYNHWPSRYGGMMNTVRLRMLAAKRLVGLVDSVKKENPDAKIMVLGDFNDNREDESIRYLMDNEHDVLRQLPYQSDFYNVSGTIKHHADWAVFDQVMVSDNLLNISALHVKDGKMHIFDIDFLLINDNKDLGVKLNRTFIGFKYAGGFSDHLPVYVDLVK